MERIGTGNLDAVGLGLKHHGQGITGHGGFSGNHSEGGILVGVTLVNSLWCNQTALYNIFCGWRVIQQYDWLVTVFCGRILQQFRIHNLCTN